MPLGDVVWESKMFGTIRRSGFAPRKRFGIAIFAVLAAILPVADSGGIA